MNEGAPPSMACGSNAAAVSAGTLCVGRPGDSARALARRALLAWTALSACSGGCGAGEPGRDPGAIAATESTQTAGSASQPDQPGPSPGPHADSTGAPIDPAEPTLELALGSDHVLHVRNVGSTSARLRGGVLLERRIPSGEWESLPLEMGLRGSCDEPIPECVDLAPGAELLPPPWLGTTGHGQCACERCVRATGELRFVVETCAPAGHTPRRLEGLPFRR